MSRTVDETMADTGRSAAAGAAREAPPKIQPSDAEIVELCRLLTGIDRTRLLAVIERFEDRAEFVEYLGDVLGDAVRVGGARDDRLGRAIAPLVSSGVHETVRRDPAGFGEVLAPAMGPAIRQSVRQMLEGLVASFERAIELSVSPKSLKWRVEAWRTGRPFAEVMLLHTLEYRVEHVFWIHRETGLLLQHVAGPSPMAAAKSGDADVMSAMLTAIQDFVRDAFEARDDETLRSFQVGDLNVWVEQGTQTVLAGVVRGQAPRSLRDEFRQTLDRIEVSRAADLSDFRGEVRVFDAVQPDLEGCLVERRRDEPAKTERVKAPSGRRRAWLAVVAVVALVVLGTYWWIDWRREARFEGFVAALNDAPGIQLIHAERDGGTCDVRGLRDPFAVDPLELALAQGMRTENVRASFDLYHAGDANFALRRVRELVGVPAGVELRLIDGVLRCSGTAGHAWVTRVQDIARVVPGIQSVHVGLLVDADREKIDAAVEAVEQLNVPVDLASGAFDAEELRGVADAVGRVQGSARALGESLSLHCFGVGVEPADGARMRAVATVALRDLSTWVAVPGTFDGLRQRVGTGGRAGLTFRVERTDTDR